MKPFHHLLQSTLFLILSRCLSKDRRHVFFFEIGRDVEGIEVLEVLSMTYVVFAGPLGSRRQVLSEAVEYVVFAGPLGSRRQVLSEAVEYPRGRAPGRAKR